MDLRKFAEFANSGYYWPTVAVTALGIGVAIGTSVDRICSRNRPAEVDPVEWEDDEGRFPEIPEGVNEIQEDRVIEDRIFAKPDITKLIDYTKYSDKAGIYKGGDEDGDVPPKEFPDDSEAPEALDDPRMEIIDEAEFMKATGNMDGYVSVTCGYFTHDKILAGWDEAMEEKDIGETVGWRAVKMFDSPDVKAVYVRNTHLKVLYEIIRYDDTYEEVLADVEQKNFDAGEEKAEE